MNRLEIANIREGIKIIMDNPNIVLEVENKSSYDNRSNIYIDQGNFLVEESFEEDDFFYGHRKFVYKPVNLDVNRKCFISGDCENNFLYYYNYIASSENIPTCSELSEALFKCNVNNKLLSYCKDVYWIFLKTIIDDLDSISPDKKDYLHDLLYD